MANNKMLIDATHPEETRVVVLRGGRVEEFDYESAARKLLRGNIYLAKVTRVEPSLQAAFVDYGGNRHGFLAFNEIHPDYYQIPMADRQALLDEEAAAEAEEEAAADARAEALARRRAQRESRGEEDSNGNGNGHRGGRRDRGDRDRGHNRGRDRDRDRDRDAEGNDRPHHTGEAPRHDARNHSEHRHAEHDEHRHAEHDERQHSEHDEHRHGEHDEHGHAERDEREAHEPYASADIRHVHDEAHDEAPETIGEATVEPHASEHHDEDDTAHDEDAPRQSREATGLRDDVRTEAAADAASAETDTPVSDDASVVIQTIAENAGARVAPANEPDDGAGDADGDAEGEDSEAEAEAIDQVGAEDAAEEVPSRPRRRPRSYKIQEVIKRRQVILIQVVKEERGNKGAALTTYLSLAGRYTVLMPNTARGGGISRKITQPQDRKRLKAIAAELEVPEGMGLIIRTAGAARTKQEIKRDFEYLLRLWESVRDLTLRSVAPSLVYEEGNLIKRSIRDLYNKDVEEVIVAGREAHGEAHDFMRMLMPSHAKNVIEYREPEPLFTRFQIERQLNAMFSPYVTLRSGGYLVINQTEALVAIDVNSGKSTREFSIEETALNTNLEAAEEIARQLKLRDLAGLIVIDFIDMEERRNNRKVENRLKDALRFDRARIQVGRISHFGLMEMSRQRLRTGVLEGSTSQCPHCQGTGIIRSTESVALAVLRGLEDAIMAGARTSLIATTTPTVALYILNHKRQFITDMELRTGLPVIVQGSDKVQGANFTIEKGAAPAQPVRRPDRTAVNMDWGFEAEDDADASGEVIEETVDQDGERGELLEAREPREGQGNGEERRGRRRRRRRGGRRGERGEGVERGAQEFDDRQGSSFARDDEDAGEGGEEDHARDHHDHDGEHDHAEAGGHADEPVEAGAEKPAEGEGRPGEGRDDRPRRRRRGRRGGRRNRERGEHAGGPQSGAESDEEQLHPADNDDAGPNDIAYEHEAEGVAIVDSGVADSEPQPDIGNLYASRESEGGRAPRRDGHRDGGRGRHGRNREEASERAEHVTAAENTADREPETAAPAQAPAEPRRVAEAAKPSEPAPERRARGEPIASEPKIERVVVRADQTDATPEVVPEPEKPARKGWWSKALGRD